MRLYRGRFPSLPRYELQGKGVGNHSVQSKPVRCSQTLHCLSLPSLFVQNTLRVQEGHYINGGRGGDEHDK